MAPVVHGLEIEYWGEVEFVYLDVDSSSTQKFQQQLGFYYQPQIFLLDGEGNVVQEFAGTQPEQRLREALDALVGS